MDIWCGGCCTIAVIKTQKLAEVPRRTLDVQKKLPQNCITNCRVFFGGASLLLIIQQQLARKSSLEYFGQHDQQNPFYSKIQAFRSYDEQLRSKLVVRKLNTPCFLFQIQQHVLALHKNIASYGLVVQGLYHSTEFIFGVHHIALYQCVGSLTGAQYLFLLLLLHLAEVEE